MVVKSFMRYLKSLTARLQEKGADISKAYQHVQTVQSTLVSVREEIEDKHDLLFEEASKIASENNISVLRPWTCNVQKYRENHDAGDVSSYYRVSLTLPFIDSLITSMAERFTPKNLALYCGFNILPSIMLKTDHWTTYFKEFLDAYLGTIIDVGCIDAELDLWHQYWLDAFTSELEAKCASIADVLKMLEKDDFKKTFPIIYNCLKILATVPVTSCECERSISVIRRLKTYLRSTMVQVRFTSLALLSIRRDFELNLDAIINTFATKHSRRMKLVNILDSDKLSE